MCLLHFQIVLKLPNLGVGLLPDLDYWWYPLISGSLAQVRGVSLWGQVNSNTQVPATVTNKTFLPLLDVE